VTEVLHTAWAVARSGWRATWNRSLRFSRVKVALIWLLLQALFFWLLTRRTPTLPQAMAQEGIAGLTALLLLQMSWFGLMYGFARGQFQLYQGILVPLFQITPARPLGFLLGRVIEAVPTRAWSALLWAWVYASMIPSPTRWTTWMIMALLGLLVSMVAHLSGLLLLSYWGKVSARTMRTGLSSFGIITLGLATWAAIFLATGGTLTELALVMREYRMFVFGAVVITAAIPGTLLLGLMFIHPDVIEAQYREGVQNVIELAESDLSRPARSLWLPLSDPTLRAVLSREWLELFRSRMTRIQLAIWVAGTVGVYVAGRAVYGDSMSRVIQFVGFQSLFTWFMAYGHWVVRVFEKERRTLLLYRLAAVPTRRLLLAKVISVFTPSLLLVFVSSLIGGLAAGLTPTELLKVVLYTFIALATGTLGGFGAAAATASEAPEEQEVDAGPRRTGDASQPTGNAWYSIVRTIALVVTAGLPIWIAAGQPGLPWKLPFLPLWLIAILLPLAVLGFGVRLMIWHWERVGTES
jgi:hypothetical protein